MQPVVLTLHQGYIKHCAAPSKFCLGSERWERVALSSMATPFRHESHEPLAFPAGKTGGRPWRSKCRVNRSEPYMCAMLPIVITCPCSTCLPLMPRFARFLETGMHPEVERAWREEQLALHPLPAIDVHRAFVFLDISIANKPQGELPGLAGQERRDRCYFWSLHTH